MASENKTSMRQWFIGLPTPAKALLVMIPVGVAAVAIAAIVIGGPPKHPTPAAAPKTPAAESAAATVAPEVPPGHPAIGSSSAATSSAVEPSKSTGSTKASSSAKKSSGTAADAESEVDPKTKDEANKIPADAERPPGALTNAWRLKIAREIVDAEQRAKSEADIKYPTDTKNGGSKDNAAANDELRSRLLTSYTDAIAAKYKLTSDELISILVLDAASLE